MVSITEHRRKNRKRNCMAVNGTEGDGRRLDGWEVWQKSLIACLCKSSSFHDYLHGETLGRHMEEQNG